MSHALNNTVKFKLSNEQLSDLIADAAGQPVSRYLRDLVTHGVKKGRPGVRRERALHPKAIELIMVTAKAFGSLQQIRLICEAAELDSSKAEGLIKALDRLEEKLRICLEIGQAP